MDELLVVLTPIPLSLTSFRKRRRQNSWVSFTSTACMSWLLLFWPTLHMTKTQKVNLAPQCKAWSQCYITEVFFLNSIYIDCLRLPDHSEGSAKINPVCPGGSSLISLNNQWSAMGSCWKLICTKKVFLLHVWNVLIRAVFVFLQTTSKRLSCSHWSWSCSPSVWSITPTISRPTLWTKTCSGECWCSWTQNTPSLLFVSPNLQTCMLLFPKILLF